MENDDAAAEQTERAFAHLADFGVPDDEVRKLAAATHAEVVIPFVKEEFAWEARVFPWEYVISAATRRLRGDRPLYVFRRIRRYMQWPEEVLEVGTPILQTPEKLLYIESAPCHLDEHYQFLTERRLIVESLELTPEDLQIGQLDARKSADGPAMKARARRPSLPSGASRQ